MSICRHASRIQRCQGDFTDSKTDRGSTPQAGGVHGYDDKRDQHLDELRRRFAASVIERIHKLSKSEGARTVILAASARMRRFLFHEMDNQIRPGYRLHKLSKNMINFSPIDNESGPQWIQMDVTHQLQQVGVFLTQY